MANVIELDELFFDALRADEDIMTATGGRITSTCFEVSPDELDNTKTPCIIVTDDGLRDDQQTKDDVWESDKDRVQASVEVDADSPKEVKRLVRMARKAIANYILLQATQGNEIPSLISATSNGVAWDWMKPCYHSTISYQCDINNHLYDDEQAEG